MPSSENWFILSKTFAMIHIHRKYDMEFFAKQHEAHQNEKVSELKGISNYHPSRAPSPHLPRLSLFFTSRISESALKVKEAKREGRMILFVSASTILQSPMQPAFAAVFVHVQNPVFEAWQTISITPLNRELAKTDFSPDNSLWLTSGTSVSLYTKSINGRG